MAEQKHGGHEIAARIKDVMRILEIPTTESTKDTPSRVARFLLEYKNPITDVSKVLGPKFDANGHSSLLVQQNIPFRMLCEHHLLPALGKAAIGYVPHKHLVGLSKFTRLVQAVGTECPSLQEAIGDRIADLLIEYVDAKGVAVILKAEHTCMACRGVATPGVHTTTSSLRGLFERVDVLRSEFFELIKM